MTSATTTVINIIGSAASLLSSEIFSDCQTSDDETCQGGVAAVAAYIRHYCSSKDEKILVIPQLDTQSQFVSSHPMGWNINQFIFQDHFHWKVFTTATNSNKSPSLLLSTGDDTQQSQNQQQYRNISGLQTPDMPLLLTNVAVPSTNSWKPYIETVHFDKETKVALIMLVEKADSNDNDNNENNNNNNMIWSDAALAAMTALDYIASENKRFQCTPPPTITRDFRNASVQNVTKTMTNLSSSNSNGNNVHTNQTVVEETSFIGSTNNNNDKQPSTERCWMPVIMIRAASKDSLEYFISTLSDHDNSPVLIMDLEGKHQSYSAPQILRKGIWVLSQPLNREQYYVHSKLTMDIETGQITDVVLRTQDRNSPILPEIRVNDTQYSEDIQFMHELAKEAMIHDPVVGNSNTMSPAANEKCSDQECEIGNLIVDTLKWKTNSDIAFMEGSTIQGPGWSFGLVHVSDIWKAIPKSMTICSGTIQGSSLINLLSQAVSSDNKVELLQVSGLQIVYNTQLEQASTKLVSVKVWDQNSRDYYDINPLRLYKFATASDLCEKESLLFGGEQILIDETLVQNTVGEYLGQLTSTYVPVLEDRLINDINAVTSMDLENTANVCEQGKYWETTQQACFACPSSTSYVTVSDKLVKFKTKEDETDIPSGRFVVVNRDLHDYLLVPEGIPSWFSITGATTSLEPPLQVEWPNAPLVLASGERIAFEYNINTTELVVGTTFSTVYIHVSDYKTISGCYNEKYTLTVDALVEVIPSDTIIRLGTAAGVGLSIMALIFLICIGCLIWVFRQRERWGYGKLGEKSTKSIQPVYLTTICIGVLIISLTMVPLSIDDPAMSGMCLVAPWLISLGLTTVFSALLSKLNTAKKMLDNPNSRVIEVSTKDLVMPFVILFSINFAILFCMLIDPPVWGQEVVSGDEDWKFYGTCQYSELSASLTFASALVHLLTLLYTCFRAYRVSCLTGEFNELKHIGLSVFVWLQIVIIAVPFWFIIKDGDVSKRYYYKVGILCALCLSMLLCVFGPVLKKTGKERETKTDPEEDNNSIVLFGNNFLGLGGLTGGSGASRKVTPAADEENYAKEEQFRCFADRLCY